MERSYVRRIAGLGIALGLLVASSPGQITTNIWDGESSADWTVAANWTNSTANDVALADGDAVEFYAVGNNLSTILGQDWIIDRLIFNAGADSDVTIGGANTLTISNGIIVDADSAGAHAILANVALAQNQTWTIDSTLTNFTGGGVISGVSGATLTKAGAGTLALTNANTYDGGTTVGAGTLVAAHDNALGGGSVTITNTSAGLRLGDGVTVTNNLIIGNAGNAKSFGLEAGASNALFAGTILIQETAAGNFDIRVDTGGTLTISNVISRSAAGALAGIDKIGSGTLILSGDNTYRGRTSIGSGTLIAGHNNALSLSNVTLTGSDSALRVADGVSLANDIIVADAGNNKTVGLASGATSGEFAGDITLNEAGAANFDLSADVGGTLTILGVIGGAGAAGVEKVGAGTVVLASNNTYTGQTTISEGVLQVGNGGVSGTLGGGAVTNNSALVFDRSDTLTVANAIRGTGILTNAGGGRTILTGANSYSGGSVVTAGTLELRGASAGGTGDIWMEGGDLWLLNNGNANFGNDLHIDANTDLYLGRVSLGSSVTHTVGDISIADGRTLVLRGTNLNNNQNYTMVGGDLTLAGDGTLDIREGPGSGDGTLRVNNVLAGGAGQDLVVKGNDPNQSQLFINDGLFVGGDLIVGTNALVRTPDGGTNVAGNINLRGGVLGINMDFARELGTGDGQVQLTSDGTRQSGFSAFDNPVVVRIEDAGGNLTNLVWGSSTFNPGQLMLNQDDANAAIELQNSIDLDVGSGSVDRTINVHNNIGTISGAISNGGAGSANFVKGGGGTLALTGPTEWNGQTRITSGTLRLTNVTALATSFASSNLFLNPGNAIGVLETQGLLTNALGVGVGEVRIVGGGNAGQNPRAGFSAYGGDLTIDLGGDGTGTGSQLVWGSTLFDPSGISTNNGALYLNTANADGTVRLMNDIDLNGEAGLLTPVRRIGVNGSTAVLAGDITNSSAIAVGILKRGAGSLVLAGNSSYEGPTEVTGGSLLVNGSHFGGGDYTVSGGATLGGTGIIGSAVLIASNAVMSPGNSIGTFTTTNNFTFSTGGVLQIELDHILAASDMLVVSGALDISGAILSLTNLGTGGDLALLDDTFIIAQYGSLIGDTFFNHADVLGLLPTGYEIEYNYLGGNQIALVIPEPGAIAALLLGGAVIGALARRRRAKMAAMGEARR